MFSSKLSLGAVAALALASSANAIATDLTADNFDSLVGGGKGSFIKFYAPWCVRSIRERCLISMFGARRVASRRGVAREGFGRASDRRLINFDPDLGVILFSASALATRSAMFRRSDD